MEPDHVVTEELSQRQEPPEQVSVAILAGGKSSRMGEDKALIRLFPDDRPLLGEVISRVRSLTDDLFVVATDRPEYARFGVPIVPDRFPGFGPLAGIVTALIHSRHERCLVVSCDHPFLNTRLLRSMIDTRGEWDALIPGTDGESRQDRPIILHTLHAVYRKSCIAEIENSIQRGELRTIGFLGRVRVKEIPSKTLLEVDPELMSLFSVNSPEALLVARNKRRTEIEIERGSVD